MSTVSARRAPLVEDDLTARPVVGSARLGITVDWVRDGEPSDCSSASSEPF
jgi:hypothetical protein